jgi:hypothetical protein
MQVMGLSTLPLIDDGKIVEASVNQSKLTMRYTEPITELIRGQIEGRIVRRVALTAI